MVTFGPKAGKWLALALLVSLGANMFLGGLLAGRFANRQVEPTIAGVGGANLDPQQPLATAIRRIAAALPEQDRTRFEQAFLEHRREIVRANLAVREARLGLRDALMADPFDRPRVEQGFAELRTRNEEVQHVLHAIAIDAIARMPAESRQALANWGQAAPRQPAARERPRAPGGPAGPGTNRP